MITVIAVLIAIMIIIAIVVTVVIVMMAILVLNSNDRNGKQGFGVDGMGQYLGLRLRFTQNVSERRS